MWDMEDRALLITLSISNCATRDLLLFDRCVWLQWLSHEHLVCKPHSLFQPVGAVGTQGSAKSPRDLRARCSQKSWPLIMQETRNHLNLDQNSSSSNLSLHSAATWRKSTCDWLPLCLGSLSVLLLSALTLGPRLLPGPHFQPHCAWWPFLACNMGCVVLHILLLLDASACERNRASKWPGCVCVYTEMSLLASLASEGKTKT